MISASLKPLLLFYVLTMGLGWSCSSVCNFSIDWNVLPSIFLLSCFTLVLVTVVGLPSSPSFSGFLAICDAVLCGSCRLDMRQVLSLNTSSVIKYSIHTIVQTRVCIIFVCLRATFGTATAFVMSHESFLPRS